MDCMIEKNNKIISINGEVNFIYDYLSECLSVPNDASKIVYYTNKELRIGSFSEYSAQRVKIHKTKHILVTLQNSEIKYEICSYTLLDVQEVAAEAQENIVQPNLKSLEII